MPKAIAVVEINVTETSVLKLFDQSVVSCEFVNELCPICDHFAVRILPSLPCASTRISWPSFRRDSSISSANRIRFTFDGKSVTTPAVAEVVEEDVAALREAAVADVTPANAIKVRNENLRGSD